MSAAVVLLGRRSLQGRSGQLLRKRLTCVRLGQEGLRARVRCVDAWTNRVLTRGVGWAYKRGPFGAPGGCCLRLWRRGKGCADGGQTGVKLGGAAGCSRICERLVALDED